MNAAEICSKGTVHIPLSCTLQEAAKQMRDQHVGALAVTEGGKSGRIVDVLERRAHRAHPRFVLGRIRQHDGLAQLPEHVFAREARSARSRRAAAHGARSPGPRPAPAPHARAKPARCARLQAVIVCVGETAGQRGRFVRVREHRRAPRNHEAAFTGDRLTTAAHHQVCGCMRLVRRRHAFDDPFVQRPSASVLS